MRLQVAGIEKESVVDGPGIRSVIFFQGCPHNCPGCHNPESHNPQGGYTTTTADLLAEIVKTKLIRGVTLSGGEPFEQAEALVELAKGIRAAGLDIVTYTGYLFDDLLKQAESRPAFRKLLEQTDLLVDGAYMEEQRDLSLAFRGSRNQRLIDCPKSLAANSVVPWEVKY